jgi:hypothetical protein
MTGNAVQVVFCTKIHTILRELENVPHLKEKALLDLVNGLEVSRDLITYKRDQGLWSRMIGALDGSNRRREIIIQEQTQGSLETLTDWMLELTREARFSQEVLTKVADKLRETRCDLAALGKAIVDNRSAIAALDKRLAEVGRRMDCELEDVRSRVERVEDHQAIQLVTERWESGRLFAGYPALVQGAFAVDDILRGSLGRRVHADAELRGFLHDRVVNILRRQESIGQRNGSLERVWLPTVTCCDQVRREVAAFGLEAGDMAPLHRTLAAAVSTGEAPDWLERAQIGDGMPVFYDCSDLVEDLMRETSSMN